ncbi:hypothetical protein N0Y54_29445 [Nostoc punctiforme UO1]|uniref:hypothetical protein n=1 Tax=Nostoc punctiforme TaxID=272131 RepID=UPI00309E4A6C
MKVTHQEHRVPIAFFPPAEALPPGFVRIVGHVERVHLQNRLKGELLTMWLKYGVALSGELTSIDEVVRGKTNLACLYCGGGLTAKKGNVKEHHFAHTLETCKFVSQRIKTKAFPSLPLYDNFNIQLKGEELEQLKVLWKCDSLISESR